MSIQLRERIAFLAFLLLALGLVSINTIYATPVAKSNLAEPTNTAVYSYLPILIKPVDTPTTIPASTPSPMDIKIEYILYNPDGNDVDGEYVRLRNNGSANQNMVGWTLRDAANTVFTFPDFVMAPDNTVLIWTKDGTNNQNNLYWGKTWSIWNNTGDTATLRDQSGQTVDTCTYAGGDSGEACP
jgi:hypothetical protein